MYSTLLTLQCLLLTRQVVNLLIITTLPGYNYHLQSVILHYLHTVSHITSL